MGELGRRPPMKTINGWWHEAGWIEAAVAEELVSKPISIMSPIDGSEASMTGLHYVINDLMQHDRTVSVQVLHVYDDKKTDLPLAWRKEYLRETVEARLISNVSSKRSQMVWVPKGEKKAGAVICEQIQRLASDFVVIGFLGRKGRKEDVNKYALTSNTLDVLIRGNCTTIIIKDEDVNHLPTGRPTNFVVSVSLNKASTKAFLDALRLSQPGDEIHLVYVRAYMEKTDSDYTTAIKEKYSSFFEDLKGDAHEVFRSFRDRKTSLNILSKKYKQSTSQAVVSYADEVEADFIVVGTNTLRVSRGKPPLGSVSLQICVETDRNLIVANFKE